MNVHNIQVCLSLEGLSSLVSRLGVRTWVSS